MNLIDIKNYLKQVKIASLATLCSNFQCDADLVRCMMMHWTRKGTIRKFSKTPGCGGSCNKCDFAVTEIYEWIDVENGIRAVAPGLAPL